jgi:hypothetical protein
VTTDVWPAPRPVHLSLTDRLLRALADGTTRRTGDLIASCSDWEGWEVRQTLDQLAADGAVIRKKGKRKAAVWRLAPPAQEPVLPAWHLQEREA